MFTVLHNFKMDSPASGSASGNGHRLLPRPILKGRRDSHGRSATGAPRPTPPQYMSDERETTENGW